MTAKEVKANLNKPVKLSGKAGNYILSGAIFRKGKQGFFYQAELQDTKSNNSIVIAKLEDVEPAKGSACENA